MCSSTRTKFLYLLVTCSLISTIIIFLMERKDIRNHFKMFSRNKSSVDVPNILPNQLPFTTISSNGNLTYTVHLMNENLIKLRQLVWNEKNNKDWENNMDQSGQKQMIYGEDEYFISQLLKQSNVYTILIPWLNCSAKILRSDQKPAPESSDLLIQNYYQWTADDRLCTWLETPGINNLRNDILYNRTCVRDMNQSAVEIQLQPLFLKSAWLPYKNDPYPLSFYANAPKWGMYLNVIFDGIVTSIGDLFKGNIGIAPAGCRPSKDVSPTMPRNVDQLPKYNEVFVISQYWGAGYFHGMVEVIPRIAPFLEFLLENPHIRIQMFGLSSGYSKVLVNLLKILGIDESRLVSGDLRSKIVYLPRPTDCGRATPPAIQILSKLYNDYIKQKFPIQPRKKIVLIRRSGERRFTEQTEIESRIKMAATEFDLEFELFIDNPAPSLNATMRLFNSAVMVIGPHGAGLANIVFSEPGTYVVEGVCNIPHVNLCFQHLAHVLGHHWHGVPSRQGCLGVVDAPAESIVKAVRTYLAMRLRE